MTTITLRRQMDRLREKLEDLRPGLAPRVTLLYEPRPDADKAQRLAYTQELAKALAEPDQVVLVVGVNRPHAEVVEGVRYFPSDFEAVMAMLAMQPSTQGKASRLGEMLDNLSGNVIGPTSLPSG